ncbi:30S ribosomal protein S9 [Bienertia sinuspersici]
MINNNLPNVLGRELPSSIEFINEKCLSLEQKVTYEWVPTLCSICGGYGHLEATCKKKDAGAKKWVPKK